MTFLVLNQTVFGNILVMWPLFIMRGQGQDVYRWMTSVRGHLTRLLSLSSAQRYVFNEMTYYYECEEDSVACSLLYSCCILFAKLFSQSVHIWSKNYELLSYVDQFQWTLNFV
jgi:hypothetical protein